VPPWCLRLAGGRRAADQQAKLDALLLEAIAALGGLFGEPDHPA